MKTSKLLTFKLPENLLRVDNTFSELEIDGSLLSKGTNYRRWVVFLAFFVLLFTGLSANYTFGQSVTVSPWRNYPQGTTKCQELIIQFGDKLTGTTQYTVGPGGPGPNISNVRIYANGGTVFSADVIGGSSQSINITVEAPKIDVCIGADRIGYDPDDLATVTVSIVPHANFTAVQPVVNSNGDISYGYRLGGVLWNPRGYRVTTQLAYYNQSSNQFTQIAECTMEINTNISRSCPTVSASQVPAVPNGTTHLVTRVDQNLRNGNGVIPESNENDNIAFSDLPKPNLRITNIAYDTENNIKVFFRFDSLLPLTPPNVQFKLNYAKGTQSSNVIGGYRALMEHDFSLQGLTRNQEYYFQANRGDYPLPTWDATHLLASIDLPDNRIIETNDTDNIRNIPVQIAPGYTRLDYGKGEGVAIYKNGFGFYVTVVDLTKATLASSLNRESAYLGQLKYHFNKGLRGNTSRRSLKVVVNGALFKEDLYNNLLTEFTYGLKHNARLVNLGANSPVGGRTDISVVAFAFDRSSASITINKHALLNDRRYRNVLGTLTTPNPPTTEPNTKNVVGLRDQVGNGIYGESRYQTLLIFSTRQNTTTFPKVVNELKLFGAQRTAQLDSGASTGLIAAKGNRGIGLLRSFRPIPEALLIYGGKQPIPTAHLSIGSNSAIANEENISTDVNILAIKKSGNPSGTTEFSVLSGEGDFANIFNQLPTGIHATDDNYQFLLGDWDRDGYNDLFVVKKLGVSSTEIHILSGASGYKKYLFQSATGLHQTNAFWKFALTDWDNDNRPDLVAISRAGGASGRAEAHILSAASNYQQFILHAVTPLPYLDLSFDIQVGDWDGDSRPDLIAVKRDGVSSTEVHIVGGTSNWTQYALQTGTALHKTDSTWSFAVTDWDGGGKVDLVGFKKQNTGTNSTEIHVLQGETQFQNFILQIGTALPQTGGETELIVANNAAEIGDFDPAARKYAYNQDGIYLFRNNEILEYTGETPNGWRLIDNNSSSSEIASTTAQLYQFHRQSGYVYWFNKSINNWQEVSNNTSIRGIATTNDDLYIQNNTGAFYRYNGAPYSWTLISQDPLSVAIGATDDSLFQMHNTGRILQWNGSSWTTISTSYSTRQMITTADDVFARRDIGEIFIYNQSEWIKISEADAGVVSIYSDGETIYRQHYNGYVYRYTGTPLTGWRLVKW